MRNVCTTMTIYLRQYFLYLKRLQGTQCKLIDKHCNVKTIRNGVELNICCLINLNI